MLSLHIEYNTFDSIPTIFVHQTSLNEFLPPLYLFGSVPMFPQPYVPTFLRAFSKLGLMFPQLCVPTFLIFITKLGPMFLQFPHFYPCLVVKGSPFRSWRFEGAS